MIRWRVVAIGLPLTVFLLTVGLNVALGASAPSLTGIGLLPALLMVFVVRLINPGHRPVGE